MKIQATQLKQHLPFLILGILSWLGFSYLYLVFIKLGLTRSISNMPWSWDAPLWTFLDCLIGATIIIFVKWKFNLLTEKSTSLLKDFGMLLLLIPLISISISLIFIVGLGYVFAGGKATKEYEILMSFLSNCISLTFVAMTCIGYFYLNLVNKTKEKLAAAQQAKSEMELKTLRQNIEPHFLFNNLNVLSSLIESNPARANEFLSKMSEIYRYILQAQNADLVPIKDELEFAENYVFLLKERFGAAYDFDWQVDRKKLNGQMIVPVSLQSLIENAVKHNSGDPENPLSVVIKLENEYLAVENETREKRLTFQTNKSGLENLKIRYAFLTEKTLEITRTESFFKVKLPLLHAE